MVLRWYRTSFRGITPLFSDYWTLAQLPAGVTLKRVVLDCAIVCRGTLNDASAWMAQGIVNTVEVTYGMPPPFPLNPGTKPLDGRDLLHTGMLYMSPDPGLSFASTTGGGRPVEHIDVQIQRKDPDYPAIVWWSWGIQMNESLPQTTGALSRGVVSVLVDEPIPQ